MTNNYSSLSRFISMTMGSAATHLLFGVFRILRFIFAKELVRLPKEWQRPQSAE
jgi:hypothetical protein